MLVARTSGLTFIFVLAKVVGDEGTGVFVLATSAVGIMGALLNLGIPNNYPHFLISKNLPIQKIASLALSWSFVSSIVGLVIWIASVEWIRVNIFGNSITSNSAILAGFCLPCVVVESQFVRMLQALDRLGSFAVCTFVSLALPVGAILFSRVVNPSSDSVLIGLFIGKILSVIVHVFLLFRLIPFTFCVVTMKEFKELVGYGFKGYLGGLASLANYRLDRILLGVFAGPAVVGIYAVLSSIAETGRMVPMALQTSFTPKAAAMKTSLAKKKTIELMVRISKFVIPFFVIVVPGSFLVFSFLNISYMHWIDLVLLCIGIAAVSITSPIVAFNISVGLPMNNTYGAVAGLVLTVMLAPILIPALGITGACLTSCLAYIGFGLVLGGVFQVGSEFPQIVEDGVHAKS